MSTNFPLFLTFVWPSIIGLRNLIESDSGEVSDSSVSQVVILVLYNPRIIHFARREMCCDESERCEKIGQPKPC